MGDSARETNVFALLSALETILSSNGYEVAYGSSLAAAQQDVGGVRVQELACQRANSRSASMSILTSNYCLTTMPQCEQR